MHTERHIYDVYAILMLAYGDVFGMKMGTEGLLLIKMNDSVIHRMHGPCLVWADASWPRPPTPQAAPRFSPPGPAARHTPGQREAVSLTTSIPSCHNTYLPCNFPQSCVFQGCLPEHCRASSNSLGPIPGRRTGPSPCHCIASNWTLKLVYLF